MHKFIFALLFISGISLVLNGCATTTGPEMSKGPQATESVKTYQPDPKSVTVGLGAGGGVFEYCEDEWKVGDTVSFSFTSTKPVTFNAHYHDAQEVKHYSIKNVLTDDFSGKFTMQDASIHCGQWINNNDSFVKLTYKVEVMNE